MEKIKLNENWRMRCLNNGRISSEWQNAVVPVSYTHLDVYKRQLYVRAGNGSWYSYYNYTDHFYGICGIQKKF